MSNKSDKIQTSGRYLREFFTLKGNAFLFLDLASIVYIALFVSFNQYFSELVSNTLFVVLIVAAIYLLVRIGVFSGGLSLSFVGKRVGEIHKEAQKENRPVDYDISVDRKINSSLNWFTVVSVLSVINALLIIFKINIQFLVGLGAVQWIGYISLALSTKYGPAYLYVGFLINLSIAWLFYHFRNKASSNDKYVYAGLVLYVLDTLLFLPVKGYLEIGFHIFIIVMICQYFRYVKLKNMSAIPN